MATAATLEGFDGLATVLGVSRSPRDVRSRLIVLERILEGAVRLPGNQRVGLDAFIGLVPVVGDLISATIGTYLVWEARNVGVSRWACARMLGRVGLDAALGAIPVAGDLLDFFYRSNTRNVKRILAHIEKHHPGAGVIDGVRL
ncbi:DUF4112 domain-containing protein [Sandaracinobacter sp. RS1-74]|uniref:DUF4112 domain-containing protein n=1 Tax=Sandaracinobacteroides sayramensis TaxID=2913411 RepID=UPI001EDBCB04|nr:DUF4112 domain-containing protein [Sandaracinobacteroides sayramensis]MCG2840581.1 DUF4112 domain-containing protein [Sandaracinobacteroides sayramensis]